MVNLTRMAELKGKLAAKIPAQTWQLTRCYILKKKYEVGRKFSSLSNFCFPIL
jgi:hypothetical protein